MKILILASQTAGKLSPFVLEQGDMLRKVGVEVEYCGILSKGIIGYLTFRKKLIKQIQKYKPDIIHAHYGLCGLLANLQFSVPVVTTYHGCDVQSSKSNRFLSKLAMTLSKHNIFVGQRLYERANYKGQDYSILPCGLNLSVFKKIDFYQARKRLGWDNHSIYILFAGAFDNEVKNYSLAKDCIELVGGCELVELSGYTRDEVNLLLNACDCLLMTSFREASPMVIKEAMACNCPIISTDVGDVKWVYGVTEGCFLTSYHVADCAHAIRKAISFSIARKRTCGRNRIITLGLDNCVVVQKLINIYKIVLSSTRVKHSVKR